MKRILILTALVVALQAKAQKKDDLLAYQVPYFTWGKGLGITSPDSAFLMNIRFRMQNRIGITTISGSDFSVNEVEARVRRLRLRLDGYLYNPKLTYVIQLSFSRGDIDFEDSGFPNIIRDAMIIYNFNRHFALGLGQTKLPGNRQRVVSSGDLQLPDRSIVNAVFNIDRDFGLQAYYRNRFNGFHYVLRGAISNGEGRNFNTAQKGVATTGRIELLPFGEFKNNGDYFEGDLAREPKPKISMGVTYSNNENAKRTGGKLGKFLYEARDIKTSMADFLLKYNGFALATEFILRDADNPITYDPANPTVQQHVFVGHGENYQASYVWKNNYEVVGRYSRVTPAQEIQTLDPLTQQVTLGVNKYLRGHRVKLQTEFTYETFTWLQATRPNSDGWIWRFQVEAGI
ncbi:MAG TPA: porin [Cytophagales bacterium]|nr:porin [Cytophagales bacterium]